ncbi:MAG TPA: inner membrane protein YhjD [Pseudonocardiaceae bacterium]|nr:inner membrane protein YhjD [Pseudonocardiaceae bacterium]
MRARYPWLDHLVRANESFTDNHGNHYAAAITYFSVLSLVPILMVAFAAASFVLAHEPTVLAQLQANITKSVPGALGSTISTTIKGAIAARNAVGIVGLVGALYSGIGWMSNLRDALTAQWGQEKPKLPMIPTLIKDLLSLIGLGLALVISFAITAAGTGLGTTLLKLVGLADTGWARALLVVLTVVLAVAADWLVFLWVISRLPRERVSARSAMRGALAASIGFEVLKQLATILLKSATSSPTATVFGPVIGLLVFANLVSRFLLYITAWTATATENQLAKPKPVPSAVIIRPSVSVRSGIPPVFAAALFAAGTLAGVAFRRRDRA